MRKLMRKADNWKPQLMFQSTSLSIIIITKSIHTTVRTQTRNRMVRAISTIPAKAIAKSMATLQRQKDQLSHLGITTSRRVLHSATLITHTWNHVGSLNMVTKSGIPTKTIKLEREDIAATSRKQVILMQTVGN